MSAPPVISIVLPTFNRAGLICETLQSVLQQTFRDWELIVVDDGSDDHTAEIIRSMTDERIRYFFVPHTGHIGKLRNTGIQKTTGAYIAFLDSDDLWRSDKLQFQLSLLQQYPEAAFVFSNGDQFGAGAIHPPDLEPLFAGNVFLQQLIHNRFCFYAPSLIFKRSVIPTIGLMDEALATSRDIQYFYRLCYHFEGVFTNERLVKIRKHESNTSTRSADAPYLNSLGMLREFVEKQMITEGQFRQLAGQCYYKMALQQLKNDNSKDALINFLNYTKLKPFHWKGWARVLQGYWGRRNSLTG